MHFTLLFILCKEFYNKIGKSVIYIINNKDKQAWGVNMKRNIISTIKTIVFMFVSTMLLMFLVSFVFYKMHISDKSIMIGVILIYFISTFIGGFIYGKIKEKNKFLYGMMVGAMYFVILFVISAAFANDFSGMSAQTMYAALSCILGGMIGGMLSF